MDPEDMKSIAEAADGDDDDAEAGLQAGGEMGRTAAVGTQGDRPV